MSAWGYFPDSDHEYQPENSSVMSEDLVWKRSTKSKLECFCIRLCITNFHTLAGHSTFAYIHCHERDLVDHDRFVSFTCKRLI